MQNLERNLYGLPAMASLFLLRLMVRESLVPAVAIINNSWEKFRYHKFELHLFAFQVSLELVSGVRLGSGSHLRCLQLKSVIYDQEGQILSAIYINPVCVSEIIIPVTASLPFVLDIWKQGKERDCVANSTTKAV